MVDMIGTMDGNGETTGANQSMSIHGGLRLVDLAGSERVDRTGTMTSHFMYSPLTYHVYNIYALHHARLIGTQGDAARFKESVNINKSLSCIADVFTALNSNKSSSGSNGNQGHVPFRNSKLTMLLQGNV